MCMGPPDSSPMGQMLEEKDQDTKSFQREISGHQLSVPAVTLLIENMN